MRTLHLLNGGYGNGDKVTLERASRGTGKVRSWVVPKSAAIGDEVVINVAGEGLFASGRIASGTKPRTDWKNRYGANLDSIKLIDPPILLSEVRKMIPALGWARYPRSIATPPRELVGEIKNLVTRRKKNGYSDLSKALEYVDIDDLRRIALLPSLQRDSAKHHQILVRTRRKAVRRYVLWRSRGNCEGCTLPAPFLGRDGEPFLEAHHTKRRSEDGPDDLWTVIALCPNCHRRTEMGQDAEKFNRALIKKLAKLEPKRARGR
jgi:hypothetical protein